MKGALLIAAALAATSVGLPARAAGPACSGTLGGAVKGTFTCATDATVSRGKVVLVISPTGALPRDVEKLAPCSLELPDPPTKGSYTLATSVGGANVKTKSGATYFAGKVMGGEIELDVASAEAEPGDAQPRHYRLHGTARAVLQQIGGNGMVTVTTTF